MDKLFKADMWIYSFYETLYEMKNMDMFY